MATSLDDSTEFVRLASIQTIETHKAAWELLERLGNEAKIAACLRALLKSTYPNARRHIKGYIENAEGPLRDASILVLKELDG